MTSAIAEFERGWKDGWLGYSELKAQGPEYRNAYKAAVAARREHDFYEQKKEEQNG